MPTMRGKKILIMDCLSRREFSAMQRLDQHKGNVGEKYRDFTSGTAARGDWEQVFSYPFKDGARGLVKVCCKIDPLFSVNK